jgi:hypothetical protein
MSIAAELIAGAPKSVARLVQTSWPSRMIILVAAGLTAHLIFFGGGKGGPAAAPGNPPQPAQNAVSGGMRSLNGGQPPASTPVGPASTGAGTPAVTIAPLVIAPHAAGEGVKARSGAEEEGAAPATMKPKASQPQ